MALFNHFLAREKVVFKSDILRQTRIRKIDAKFFNINFRKCTCKKKNALRLNSEEISADKARKIQQQRFRAKRYCTKIYSKFTVTGCFKQKSKKKNAIKIKNR